MVDKLHIKAFSCTDGGWCDYGSVPLHDAITLITEMIIAEDYGGCRCRRGWTIAACPDKEHDCSPFNRKKFDFWFEVVHDSD